MASSEKTPGLLLNKWLGGDIPQREDFVKDNQIIDEAIAQLRDMGGSGGEGFAAHIADAVSHLSGEDRELLGRILPHSGYYVGNGDPTQTITTGFKAMFGVIFAIGKPMVEMAPSGNSQIMRFAFITSLTDSVGAQSLSTGFRACNNTLSSTGATAQGLNTSGVTYLYYLWR